MRRTIVVPREPMVDADEVVIGLNQQLVVSLALESTLQLEGMVDSIRLVASSGIAVELTLTRSRIQTRARATRTPTEIAFELGRNQGEYLQAFLLRAYRDGAAEVDHIHVEGTDGDANFDLTLVFEAFREPLPADEAQRLMDA